VKGTLAAAGDSGSAAGRLYYNQTGCTCMSHVDATGCHGTARHVVRCCSNMRTNIFTIDAVLGWLAAILF